MQLRYYQSEAIEATLDWFSSGKERPCVVLPTRTGKSLVQAELIRRIIEEHPYVRVACSTHSQELVQQNYDEIMSIWPECPAGIFSSGLKRKEAHKQILFCGIQSIYSKAAQLGHIDIIIVDEAHSIGRKSDSMWGQFFADAKAINPNVQIMGLTATPYRLDSGNLVPNTFNGIAYEYPVIDAIKEGFLCELISAPVVTHLKTNGVQKRGGEFVAGALERAVDHDPLTRACVEEIIEFGKDRRSWIIFAAGNNHAKHITEILIEHGVNAKCVTEATSKEERRQAVEDHKSGKLKCLVNNMIFTTGYNNKILDLIACMRPTQSEGLWVQLSARAMTPIYASGYDLSTVEGRLEAIANGPKPNALLLDFGRNLDRHGPIDQIKGRAGDLSSGDGEAPLKQCPSCFEPVYAAVRICPACGFEFPPFELNIDTKPSDSAVFSTQIVPIEYNVFSVQYKRNKGKDGKRDSMMVIYNTMSGQMREWVFFDHDLGTRAKNESIRWSKLRGVEGVLTLEEALEYEWPQPISILAIKDGKYYKIKKATFNKKDIDGSNE